MITLENEEQKTMLLRLVQTATFQGVDSAQKVLALFQALLNARLEINEKLPPV